MQAAVHTSNSTARNWRIALILASLVCAPALIADDPPPDLVRKAAARETETAQEESNYTYRQTVTLEEFDDHGVISGSYHEIRDIIFSPEHQRTEQFVGKPSDGL